MEYAGSTWDLFWALRPSRVDDYVGDGYVWAADTVEAVLAGDEYVPCTAPCVAVGYVGDAVLGAADVW